MQMTLGFIYQHKDIKEIKQNLNKKNIYVVGFLLVKLSISFGDDKTKTILFDTKYKLNKVKLNKQWFQTQIHL